MTATCKDAIKSMMKCSRLSLKLSRDVGPRAAAFHIKTARGDRRCAYQLAVTARRI